MLKKLVFIALGVTIIAAKKSGALLSRSRKQKELAGVGAQVDLARMPIEEAALEAVATAESLTAEPQERSFPTVAASLSKEDDLTLITGIGPTYAARLQAAGIDSFQALAEGEPDELRDIVRARGASADTVSWIAQAKEML